MSGLCETDHLLIHPDNRTDNDTVSSSTHSIDDILGNGKDNNHCANDDASADKGKGVGVWGCGWVCRCEFVLYKKPTKYFPSIKHNSSIIRFNYSTLGKIHNFIDVHAFCNLFCDDNASLLKLARQGIAEDFSTKKILA